MVIFRNLTYFHQLSSQLEDRSRTCWRTGSVGRTTPRPWRYAQPLFSSPWYTHRPLGNCAHFILKIIYIKSKNATRIHKNAIPSVQHVFFVVVFWVWKQVTGQATWKYQRNNILSILGEFRRSLVWRLSQVFSSLSVLSWSTKIMNHGLEYLDLET